MGYSFSLLEASNVIDFVEQVLLQSIQLNISDIHFEKYLEASRLRFRLDGVLQTVSVGNFFSENFTSVIRRIKLLANLDITEKRLPQDGRFSFSHPKGKTDIRVSTVPTIHAEHVVLRILDNQNFLPELKSLYFSKKQEQAFTESIRQSQNMVLVTGPTGSGKTSTLYAGLNAINTPSINILTVEDPVEYQINGINQVEVKRATGLDFSVVLRSFLRQDPDVILIGEIRDPETADIALKAALTGHLVFSTLHTKNVTSAVIRLVNMGISPHLIAASVSLIISQRLLRKNCKNCLEENTQMLAGTNKFRCFLQRRKTAISQVLDKNQEDDSLPSKFYSSKGCEACYFTGHLGRCGIYEIAPLSKRYVPASSSSQSIDAITENLRTNLISTLYSSADRLLYKKIISVEEYIRVLL